MQFLNHKNMCNEFFPINMIHKKGFFVFPPNSKKLIPVVCNKPFHSVLYSHISFFYLSTCHHPSSDCKSVTWIPGFVNLLLYNQELWAFNFVWTKCHMLWPCWQTYGMYIGSGMQNHSMRDAWPPCLPSCAHTHASHLAFAHAGSPKPGRETFHRACVSWHPNI